MSLPSNELRIGLDLTPFVSTRGGGVVYYALAMLRELSALLGSKLTVFYYPSGERLLKTVEEFHRTRTIRLNHGFDIEEYKQIFDVLYTPYYWSDASILNVPVVRYIPDLQEHFFPQFFTEEVRRYRRLYYGHSGRASTLLITPSHHSKTTIIDKFQIPEEKIRIVPHGCHPIFEDHEFQGVRPAGFPPGLERYLFYPAIPWKHKNHQAILDALAILRRQREIIPCIFAGNTGKGDPTLLDLISEINKRNLSDQVFHLGEVSLNEMKYLYRNALALIHPSLFEGFGMPVLEAMKSGCPLICSDRSSIPEIAQNAALYFDPENAADIADKLLIFQQDSSGIQQRIEIGQELARKFSDGQTARQSLSVCEEAYEKAGIGAIKGKSLRKFDCSSTVSLAILIEYSHLDHVLISGIERLTQESCHKLEIFLVPLAARESQFQRMIPSTVKIIQRKKLLKDSLLDVAEQAQGDWILFSDGNSLPLEYFVHYISSEDSETSLLCGSSYYACRDFSKMYCFSAPCDDGRQLKTTCCNDLAYSVRRRSLVDLLSKTDRNFSSLAEVGVFLYENCCHRETYRAVNYIWNRPVSPTMYYQNSFKTILAGFMPESITKLFESPAVEAGIWPAVFLYTHMPQRWRYMIWTRGKTLVPGIFSFLRQKFVHGKRSNRMDGI